SACAARLVRTTVSAVTFMIWFAGGGSTRVRASARDRSDNPLAVLTTGCASLLLCHDFQKNQPDSLSDDITRSPTTARKKRAVGPGAASQRWLYGHTAGRATAGR